MPLGGILGVLGTLWVVPGSFWASWGDFGGLWGAVGAKVAIPGSGWLPFRRFQRPNEAQKASKVKLKSKKIRLNNLMKTLLGLGWVSGGFFLDFGGVFGTLDLQKWVCGVGEVCVCFLLFFLFFNKSVVFDQIWFRIDFRMIFGGSWEDFGS